MIRKLIYKMRKRRFCKLNNWFCPDCIYHDFVFEGAIFRGNKCRYPQYGERTDRPKGEWIPVSEKLPREGQKCLVSHKGAIGIDEFIGHDLPYKWRIYLRDYDAWMPLPEPYKGGEDE